MLSTVWGLGGYSGFLVNGVHRPIECSSNALPACLGQILRADNRIWLYRTEKRKQAPDRRCEIELTSTNVRLYAGTKVCHADFLLS